jgi:hypothetical protein
MLGRLHTGVTDSAIPFSNCALSHFRFVLQTNGDIRIAALTILAAFCVTVCFSLSGLAAAPVGAA